MNNELLYSLMEDAQFTDIMSMDIIKEGTTWETYKIALNTNMSKIKKSYNEANTYYRDGDKTKALQKLKECKDGYKAVRRQLEDVEDTFWGSVCGYLLDGGIINLFIYINFAGNKGAAEWGKGYLLRFAGALVGGMIGLPTVGMVMARCIQLTQNKEKGIDTNHIIKSDLIAAIDENIAMCDRLEKIIRSSK